MLIDRVGRYIKTHGLISHGDLILVGVSGGPDSIFLLDILSRISPDYNARLHIAHLDHGLRGKESAADADFVAALSSSMKLPFTIEKRSVAQLSVPGRSPQENARAVRLNFFRELVKKLGANRIALGHTADDLIETVLLRLLIGGGPGALSGIRPKGPHGIIHPLLEITKAEIMHYLEQKNISHRIDKTNLENKYYRNRIRQMIIPSIRKINPSFDRRILNICSILADDDDYLLTKAEEAYKTTATAGNRRVDLILDEINRLPCSILRRVLIIASRNSGVPRKNFRAAHVESILNLLKGQTGRSIDLPGGYQAIKTSSRLILKTRPPSLTPSFDYLVKLPGSTRITELGLNITARSVKPPALADIADDPDIAYMDADRISGPLRVRNRNPGDRFYPLGMSHSQKVKKFLINLKIDRELRDHLPLFYDDEKILWLGRTRLDDRIKITSHTLRAWRFDLLPE